MKVISFDVGIKNLAYCIIDLSSSVIATPIEYSQCHILDWGVCNLNPPKQVSNYDMKCQYSTTKGICCSKNAKFVIDKQQYCGVHLKKQVFIPKEQQLPSLSKASKEDILKHIFQMSDIFNINKTKCDYTKQNKNNLVDLLQKYYVKPFKSVKSKTCGEASLVHLGVELRNAMRVLINTYSISSEDVILIENQISPIATKMKSIQGMLTQFFIDHENTNIVYISSSMKLKLKLNFTDDTVKSGYESTNTIRKETNTYASRKKSGIHIVDYLFQKQMIFNICSSIKNYKHWEDIFYQHKKKDDLADCLLQGLHWISKR